MSFIASIEMPLFLGFIAGLVGKQAIMQRQGRWSRGVIVSAGGKLGSGSSLQAGANSKDTARSVLGGEVQAVR